MIRRFGNKDCIEGMKEFPDQHFDLAIVDPPYGMIKKNDALMNIGNANKKNYEMFENVRPDSDQNYRIAN